MMDVRRLSNSEYLDEFRDAVRLGPMALLLFAGADPDRFHRTLRLVVDALTQSLADEQVRS